MKQKSSLFKLLMLFALTAFMVVGVSSAIATAADIPIAPVLAVTGSITLATAFIPQMNFGMSYDIVMRELFVQELMNKFRHLNGWLNEVPSYNEWVGNNVINLNEIGADPEVLINNSIYPIKSLRREDSGSTVSLNKYDTENTIITRDELYGVPYDKPGSVLRQHRETLEEVTAQHGLYSLAPTANATYTPVVKTTGTRNTVLSRKRLTSNDIIALKRAFDLAGAPVTNRVLVLCSDHVADLLVEDLAGAFANAYNNRATGVIASNYYGFKIYESTYNPVYSSDSKKAWGAAVASSTDQNASIAFYAPETAKARGTVDVFTSLAENDPEFRRSKMGAQLYHLVIPKRSKYIGALISTIDNG